MGEIEMIAARRVQTESGRLVKYEFERNFPTGSTLLLSSRALPCRRPSLLLSIADSLSRFSAHLPSSAASLSWF
jgi:hypothetical protein